jgi:hypothetical protein
MVTLIVQPVSEAREQISKALARFRKLGKRAEPVIFGAHRKPEAVLLPYEAYLEFERLTEEPARRAAVTEATESARLEGLTTSAAADVIAERWAVGDLTADQALDATVQLHDRTTDRPS